MGETLEWIEQRWNSGHVIGRSLAYSAKIVVEGSLFAIWAGVGAVIGGFLAWPQVIPYDPLEGAIGVFLFVFIACIKVTFCSIVPLNELTEVVHASD
ncbi:hypothetical protein [Halorubrum sp. DTA98]|uniref:hypothetical protein n=1 Tax=Halorubrum sp. DTA98 TaxID=3402163 RepID=UPI003AB08828